MTSEKVFIIDSDSAQLKLIRDEIDHFLRDQHFPDKAREDILVAMGEATANSIRHAYENKPGHEVRVTIEDYPEKVVFRVRDYGKKINPAKLKETPTLPPVEPHGLGIYFMKTIMDDLTYNTSHAKGNEVILTKFKEKNNH
ncbi:MAG: ATP-binding protein [Candidatus Omnitrophica bacterium]|nr:ATP-binding protein [Candidatus Omnitrophota bacterium]